MLDHGLHEVHLPGGVAVGLLFDRLDLTVQEEPDDGYGYGADGGHDDRGVDFEDGQNGDASQRETGYYDDWPGVFPVHVLIVRPEILPTRWEYLVIVSGMTDPVVDATPTEPVDPGAPYGRRPDGTPFKRSPEFRAAAWQRLKDGREEKARRRAAGEIPPKADPVNVDRSAGQPAPEQVATLPRIQREDDRAPGQPVNRKAKAPLSGDREPVPAFRAGPIAKGMNKLYVRFGKIVWALDPEIGTAIIETTRKESDDDVTVGEAWEELARVNEKARAVLLKVIAGGVMGQLLMAHVPILMAILMKDQIRSRVPFFRLAEAFLGPSEDPAGEFGPEQAGQMNANTADLEQMFAFAQGLMSNTMARGMQFPADREPRMDEAA